MHTHFKHITYNIWFQLESGETVSGESGETLLSGELAEKTLDSDQVLLFLV